MKRLPLTKRAQRFGRFALAAAILLFIILTILSGWIQKWLWMRQLGYADVFWTILLVQWTLFAASFAIVFFFVWFNLRLAGGNSKVFREADRQEEFYTRNGTKISTRLLNMTCLAGSATVALIFGLVFYPRWDLWLRFRNGGSFGQADPLFHTDLGFYIFRLPFYELVQNGLTGLAFISLAVVAAAYVYFGLLQFGRGRGFLEGHRSAIPHLSVLLLLFIACLGWGFFLDRYELLYSTLGVVYGAGYTAWNVTRISLWVMVGASAALCGMLLINSLAGRPRLVALGAGLYAGLYVVAVLLIPGLVQKLVVEPNELELETPYLSRYIDSTRRAYSLEQVHETNYPALSDLTLESISENRETISNIRLWDWRPLLQTYRQTQEIRLYYQFYDVDVDRYHLADGYHQVMLASRELSEQLPAKARTWVNEHLQFTHGYGIVMSFVSRIVGEGLPDYVIENIPPETSQGLQFDRPAVYYGESMPGYRIVASEVEEFDYPKGDRNVYARYRGSGGIPLDSTRRKLLFAWTQSDISILLSSSLQPRSRIQIWRRVHERSAKVAPFLRFDEDPYAVLSRGKLYWIQDAYTVSKYYPYSDPYSKALSDDLNYIRNSVKVVVDMYDGDVHFYVMDPRDPVLAVYRQAFPGMFRNLEELPDGIEAHLRYPEDLFTIQSDKFRTFHMTIPQVFYNQEDLWVFPREKYAGSAIPMEPYYILMKLPGKDELEYLLMTPFTPENRDNMIAWMAARCDFPDYGRMLVYQLPKDKLTYGPIQIEAMIDQDARISEQLSLWDQRGSRVIRGNLIVIPIENSFLYVEPVYLTAEGTNIPQLKRVIAVSGDRVVMEPSLGESLQSLFGGRGRSRPGAAPTALQQQELDRARKQLQEAEKALQTGDWDEFGKAMETLKQILNQNP